MINTLTYLIVAVIVFVLIAIGLIKFSKNNSRISILLEIAFLLVITSLFFESKLIVYFLLGLSILLAIINIIIKLRRKQNGQE